jgi:hypothetical protein
VVVNGVRINRHKKARQSDKDNCSQVSYWVLLQANPAMRLGSFWHGATISDYRANTEENLRMGLSAAMRACRLAYYFVQSCDSC